MQRYLITGVAGHIGSSLARWLLKECPTCEVVGIDDYSSGYPENVPEGVEFYQVPLCVPLGLKSAERYYDAIFHCAAFAAECASVSARRYTYKRNILATAALINLAINQRCGRFVFCSSMAVYGRGHAPFSEDAPLSPVDPYGISKMASEYDLRCSGLEWTSARMHNVYGPGQSLWQEHRNVLGIWMRAALEGRPLVVYGDGKQRRALTYIDDILPAMHRASWEPAARNRPINLGGAQPITILSLAELAAPIIGAVGIHHTPPRDEVRDAWCTVDRSVDVLGYQERTSLREGIERMWEWAREAWARYPQRAKIGLPYRWETPQPAWTRTGLGEDEMDFVRT
jgi:UDP-glucose 4-epimerase